MLSRQGWRRVVWVTLVVAASACGGSSPSAPTPVVEFFSREFGYRCGNWYPATPPSARTQVDMDFGSFGRLSDRARTLLDEAGARVLYEFLGGPVLRVEVDTDEIPALWESPDGLWLATTISTPGEFPIRMVVRLDHRPELEDFLAANAVGAVVHLVSSSGNWYVVVIDDRRVPELRRVPGVVEAYADGAGCIF